MNLKFASYALTFFALIATSSFVRGAGYSPVLATLLSGDSSSNPHKPFSFDPQGVALTASGVLNQIGNGPGTPPTTGFLNNDDTFEVVLAFNDLRNTDGTEAGSKALGGPGYAAIVWSGIASSVTNPVSGLYVGEMGQFDDGAAGNLKQRMSALNLTDGAFAAVLTSETFDFAGQTWDAIDGQIGTGNVDLMGAFDLQSPSAITANSGGGTAVNYTNTNFVLDVQSATVPTGVSWWQVEPTPRSRVGDGGQLLVQANPNVGFLDAPNYLPALGGAIQQLGGAQFALMNPVPEPSSLLAIAGCVGIAGIFRRRKARK